jgi:DNA-binding NarL/FixJ family response regulator
VLFVGARALAHPVTPSRAPTRRAQLQDVAAKLPRDTPAVAAYAAQFDAATGSETTWMEAATAWEACGHVINRAHCLTRAAEAIHHSDRQVARTLLHDAAKTATAAGAGALLSEIRVLANAAHLDLDDLGGQRVEPQLGLTPREMEVLSMVADGWSNRQIGAALYISPKTVSVHVSNILAKLMVSSRGEAAALAHRSGLFDR